MRLRRQIPRSVPRLLLCAPLLLAAGCGWGEPADERPLRIGFVVPPGEAAGWTRRGVELGVEEAARAALLVTGSVELLTAEAAEPARVSAAARGLRAQGAAAIIGGFDPVSCRVLAELAEREEFLFLNVGCRDGALRSRELRHTFHFEASEAMYAAQRAEAADTAGSPVLWHGTLSRYGARQLNERFESRFGSRPAPEAWPGWMAVKVLWESVRRTGRSDAPSLSAFLVRDDARFDGHKGQPLTFDPATRQLRQPLYFPAPARSTGADEPAASAATASLPTDPAARRALAAQAAAGRLAFVSNEGSGTISVIDMDDRRQVAVIPVGSRPRGIRVGPGGRRVYVALSDDAPIAEGDGDAIAVVDLDRLEVVERHRAGTDPEQFGLSPDGRQVYSSNEDAGTASITDLASGDVLATLIVGVEPEGVAVSPDGRWVYVTAETSNTVSVIDTRRMEVVASFMVDVRPRAAVFSPDGTRAYVTNEISGTISVVDAREHRVIGRIELGNRQAKPVGLAVSPDGSRVYVATGHAHQLAVIDAATTRVIATIAVGRRPWGVALSRDGRFAYTANGASNDVSVVDLEALEVIATISVGGRPWGVATSR